jgi:hypothetical protein
MLTCMSKVAYCNHLYKNCTHSHYDCCVWVLCTLCLCVCTLQMYNMLYEGAIICFVEEVSLVVHVFLSPAGAGTATFYQPVLTTSAD